MRVRLRRLGVIGWTVAFVAAESIYRRNGVLAPHRPVRLALPRMSSS
jgi:hypothetical protein